MWGVLEIGEGMGFPNTPEGFMGHKGGALGSWGGIVGYKDKLG